MKPTLNETLKEFDEQFEEDSWFIVSLCRYLDENRKEELTKKATEKTNKMYRNGRKFLTQKIKEALEGVVPKEHIDIENYNKQDKLLSIGHNNCIAQLNQNIKEYLKGEDD